MTIICVCLSFIFHVQPFACISANRCFVYGSTVLRNIVKDVELYLEAVSSILSMCQPNSFGIPVTLCLRRWSFRVSISSTFSTSEIQLSVYGLYDNYGINNVPSRLFKGKHNGSMF